MTNKDLKKVIKLIDVPEAKLWLVMDINMGERQISDKLFILLT